MSQDKEQGFVGVCGCVFGGRSGICGLFNIIKALFILSLFVLFSLLFEVPSKGRNPINL